MVVNNPKISVVMSVYNGEKYLRESIESILNQTYRDFEFIIVNDGSKDNSLKILKEYQNRDNRIIIIDQENTGLAKALNNGISIAKGKYIARMDDDDISYSHRFEKQIDFMEKHPECVVCSGFADVIDMEGEFIYQLKHPTKFIEIQKKLPVNPLVHPFSFFRKDIFTKTGGYNTIIRHQIEDVLLWNEMVKYGEIRNLDFALGKYRLSPNSISNRNRQIGKKIKEIITNIVAGNILKNDLVYLDNLDKIKINKKSIYYNRLGKYKIEKSFERKNAFNYLLKSVYYNPLNFNSWFNLFLLCLPLVLIKKWKEN